MTLEVKVSFSIILLSLNILYFYLVKVLNEVSIASCSLLVFSYLFFYLSPIIQIRKSEYSELINTFPMSQNLIINGNILISISILIYLAIYKFLTEKVVIKPSKVYGLENLNASFLLKVSFALMMPFILLNLNELLKFSQSYEAYKDYNGIIILLLTKTIFFIPIAISALFISTYGIKKHYLYLILILLLALFFKNPLIENRSGFGIAFLFLFFIAAKNILNNNMRIITFMLISMIIFFPLGEIISAYRNPHIDPVTKFITVFNTIHYDAWANGISGLDMVEKNGFTNGKQIAGSLLFFIPRILWDSKPIASGKMLGEYMVENYHHWMTNISFPFVFEGYLDFGVLGVILFSGIIAVIVFFMDLFYKSNNIFMKIISIYISVSTIFILRGPFLSSYAYTFGGVLSLIFTYWLVLRILNSKN